jgi:hypothetical protein
MRSTPPCGAHTQSILCMYLLAAAVDYLLSAVCMCSFGSINFVFLFIYTNVQKHNMDGHTINITSQLMRRLPMIVVVKNIISIKER